MDGAEGNAPKRKGADMLTLMLKTAVGVAILIAGGFCVLFGYIAYTKSKFRRLTDTHDLRVRIEKFSGEYMEKRPHAALVVGVIQGTNTATFAYGHLAGPDTPAPDGETLFEIGSITKVFTALTAQSLVAENVWTWTNAIRDVMPDSVKLAPVFDRMSIGQLATHLGGLPRLPDNLELAKIDINNPYAGYGANELRSFLRSYQPKTPPGRRLEYSNLGFGLLGHLCEIKTGKPLGEAIRERVALPLGMTNTAATFTRTNNVAVGHAVEGQTTPYWDFDALAGAGVLKSSLNDLLLFVRANLNPEDSPLAESLEACQQQQGESWTGNVGYGWQLTRTLQGELDFVWHNGGTGGFVSFIGLDRNNGNAIVMLSSSGDAMKGDFYLDTIAMEVLKLAAKISLD